MLSGRHALLVNFHDMIALVVVCGCGQVEMEGVNAGGGLIWRGRSQQVVAMTSSKERLGWVIGDMVLASFGEMKG